MSGTEIAFLAISTAMATASTVVQANSQASAARYNARVAAQNAAAARRQAEADAQREKRRQQRELAKRRTRYAAAGLSLDGAPLDLLEDAAVEGELDVLGIRQRGLAEARQYSIAADRSRADAKRVSALGVLGAADRAASGAATLAPKVDAYLKSLKSAPTA